MWYSVFCRLSVLFYLYFILVLSWCECIGVRIVLLLLV